MAIKKRLIPLIPIRGFVIFPKTVFHFDVARKKSIAAVEKAIESDGFIFLAAQTNDTLEDPKENEIYRIGTVSKIRQLIRLPDGGIRILVEGVFRGLCEAVPENEVYYEAQISEKKSSTKNLLPEEYAAILSQLHHLINDYIELVPKIAQEPFLKELPEDNPCALADAVAGNLLRRNEDKQELLEILNVKKRLLRLLEIMTSEIKILDIEGIIAARVKQQMDENNHDYYLREQLKAIKSELGEDAGNDSDDLKALLKEKNLPDAVLKKALKELSNYERLPLSSPESAIIRNYLDLICELPWNVYSEENKDISVAEKILEKDHYGMEKVKTRILEHLAVMNLTNKPSGTILCLVGAPGVGKTSVAKSVAKATGRSYVRISLGGMRDEAELRGHRKTYVGAMPGRIVNALRQAKTQNPLILLDEIDKLGADYKGDPSSALLEILDGEQNFSFRDNYLEVGIDLSKVMFIATANTVDTIPAPLLDRLEIIELSSYTLDEKLNIAKKYLVPKQLEKHGLKRNAFKITPDALQHIINGYTREAGVRKLEREIANLCRKCAAIHVKSGKETFAVSKKNVTEYLGSEKYIDDVTDFSAKIGVATGMAWTSVGGELLYCEAAVLYGSGKIQLTGKLGDVMKESAQAALSFLRSVCDELEIDKNFYKEKDIHIHFPEGAVPKDGPSAGITIAVSAASALTNRRVRGDIAMTGEISLTGRVMAIGGLKEKVLAAYRRGIREIIIPFTNQKDLSEIPSTVRDELIFHPVKDCREVLKLCLLPEETNTPLLSASKKERIKPHEYS